MENDGVIPFSFAVRLKKKQLQDVITFLLFYTSFKDRPEKRVKKLKKRVAKRKRK